MAPVMQKKIDVHIRDMKAVDINAVAAIEAKVQRYQAWTTGNFRDAYMSCYTMMVAEFEQKIVAYAVVLMAPDVAELLLIGVEPDWQGQGVGRALMSAIEQRVRAKGLHTIVLEVRSSNQQAQLFYQKQGFETMGLRKDYYQGANGQREDALLLSHTLKSRMLRD